MPSDSTVPVSEVRRLSRRFQSQAEIFPEDTDARRVGEQFAEQLEELASDHDTKTEVNANAE